MPCPILETKSYKAALKGGDDRPFESKDTVVICSYQFAHNKSEDVERVAWDLVVIDEAHRLRNVYKPSNVIAKTLRRIALPPLETITQQRLTAIRQEIAERNALFFETEAKKLDDWADDRKVVLERDIKEFDRQIKEAKRAATTALTLEAKLEGQKQVKALENQRNQKRRSLFEAQDEVDRQRDELIALIEGKLKQKSELQCLFSIRWKLC